MRSGNGDSPANDISVFPFELKVVIPVRKSCQQFAMKLYIFFTVDRSGGDRVVVGVAMQVVVVGEEVTVSCTSGELVHAVTDLGQTIVMVTHDPNAASYADRVIFLADGKIVLDQHGADETQVLDTMQKLDSLGAQ